jgi:hypothetical protein
VRAATGVVVVLAFLLAARVHADAPVWSTDSAFATPPGRLEVGLFSPAVLGVTDQVELRLHPLLFFVQPHLEGRAELLCAERWALGARARLAYPTLLLEVLAAEGALGLLPPTTDVPHTVLIELDAVGSVRLSGSHLLSVTVGAATAPRETGKNQPLLDFPFLYPRFAAMHAVATARAGLVAEGAALDWLGYHVSATGHFLPAIEGGYAIEQSTRLRFFLTRDLGLTVGYIASVARYPVGERFHLLPVLDLELALP